MSNKKDDTFYIDNTTTGSISASDWLINQTDWKDWDFKVATYSKTFTCSKCNKEYKDQVQLALRYKFKVERCICTGCMDKIFGLNISVETEELLYEQEKK